MVINYADACYALAMATTHLRDDTLDRMVRAVGKDHERLLKATAALRVAGIDYAVAGGNAVAVWVAQVDEGGHAQHPRR